VPAAAQQPVVCRSDGCLCTTATGQVTRSALIINTPESLSIARTACQRYLATTAAALNDASVVLGTGPEQYGANSDGLPAAVAGVAECAKWFPDLVVTVRPWRQSLDVAPFI
jgi:hypothetical protein